MAGMAIEDTAGKRTWADDHGEIKWDALPTLSDLLSGKVIGRGSNDEITYIANNLGLDVQFAAFGSRLLERLLGREARAMSC